MLSTILLLAALVVPPPEPPPAAAKAAASSPRFTRRNCTINYYHYSIRGLHITGGYSLNLPLTVFIDTEAETTGQIKEQSLIQMPLLPDINIGYQGRDNAFFISWLKRFTKPRIQLYFKIWV